MTKAEANAYHHATQKEAYRFYEFIQNFIQKDLDGGDSAKRFHANLARRYIREHITTNLNIETARRGPSCPYRSTLLAGVPRIECPACQALEEE